ncbi:uncharacterized protein LOC124167921 [Ischnura elegans]|uniref:uncharacterized protein LOC124167921 n=1 Tax=Ischnura elegans TaxID=197161 RepID=UPI001ED8738A|nr:uncharacterized protein LOC124167921 [Ischnura elegans]
MKVLPLLLVFVNVFILVHGHGYLKVPLNRASLWRDEIPGAPVNYDDNQLFCGGFQKQWNVNDGRCGICGDDFSLPRPRPYENTGKMSIGHVVQSYSPGDTIRVTAEITASHLGHFEFHLCPLRSPNELEQEDCFVPLPLADGSGFEYQVETWRTGEYKTKVVLPSNITCERCVIRWQYTAGNSWGTCSDGTGAVGCGPQETFRSCADVSILPRTTDHVQRHSDKQQLNDFIKKLFPRHEKVEEEMEKYESEENIRRDTRGETDSEQGRMRARA